MVLVQTKKQTSTTTVVLDSVVSVGSLLFCALSKVHDIGLTSGARTGTPNPTDNQGNTYTEIGSNDKFIFFTTVTTATGSLTITLNFTYDIVFEVGEIIIGTESTVHLIREYSGINTLDIYKEGTLSTDVPNYTVTADSTTTSDNEIIIAYFFGTTPETLDATYSNDIDVSYFGSNTLYVQDKIIVSSETPTHTVDFQYYDDFDEAYYGEGTGFSTIASFKNVVPLNPRVKLRGKCKLKGKIKIR